MINHSKTPGLDKNSFSGVLYLDDITIPVRLGVTKEERATPQDIKLSISISYSNSNSSYVSDEIYDAYCYDKILSEIKKTLLDKEYKLIEKLCHEVYSIIKPLCNEAQISVKVHKKPIAAGMPINASFEIKDT